MSVFEPSGQIQSALVTAATNHAAVTVIYPIGEFSEDKSDANALSALGARIIWDNDAPDAKTETLPAGQMEVNANLPYHAKFALVNGIAYMDGHNFFESNPTDVILQDANAADYTAIQSDLTNFASFSEPSGSATVPPCPAASSAPPCGTTAFTTDKYLSLEAEGALITAANPGMGQTLDFISEDFEDFFMEPNRFAGL